jgi:hypothetical protein
LDAELDASSVAGKNLRVTLSVLCSLQPVQTVIK